VGLMDRLFKRQRRRHSLAAGNSFCPRTSQVNQPKRIFVVTASSFTRCCPVIAGRS